MANTVTVGFKVSPDQKREINQIAKRLGQTSSEYLRSLISEDQKKLKRFIDYPDRLIFKGDELNRILELTKFLKQKTGSERTPEVIIAALELTVANESRFVSNKIKNYLTQKQS